MFKFIQNMRRIHKIQGQIDALRLKNEKLKLKNALNSKKEASKSSKIKHISRNLENVADLKAAVEEVIPSNQVLDILRDPQVQQIIAKLLKLDIPAEDKKAAVSSFLENNPDVIDIAKEYIANQK